MKYNGASVKKMKILDRTMDKENNTRLNGESFVQLLQACPNLEEIVFCITCASDYLVWMDENSSGIELEYLKCTDVDDDHYIVSRASAERYMSLTAKYVSKMGRVKVYLILERFGDLDFVSLDKNEALNLNNTNSCNYLNRFSCLTHIHVAFEGCFAIRSVLNASPSLTHLGLFGLKRLNDLEVEHPELTTTNFGDQEEVASTVIYHNLKNIKIEMRFFLSTALYEALFFPTNSRL